MFTAAVAVLALAATVYFGMDQRRVAHKEEETRLLGVIADNVGKANDQTSEGRAAKRLVEYAAGELKAEFGVDVSNDVLATMEGTSPSDVRRRLEVIVQNSAARNQGAPHQSKPRRGRDNTSGTNAAAPTVPSAADTASDSRYYVVLKTYSTDQLESADRDRLELATDNKNNLLFSWAFSVYETDADSLNSGIARKIVLVWSKKSGCGWTKGEANALLRERLAYGIPMNSSDIHVVGGGTDYPFRAVAPINPTVQKSDVGRWKLLIADPEATEDCR